MIGAHPMLDFQVVLRFHCDPLLVHIGILGRHPATELFNRVVLRFPGRQLSELNHQEVFCVVLANEFALGLSLTLVALAFALSRLTRDGSDRVPTHLRGELPGHPQVLLNCWETLVDERTHLRRARVLPAGLEGIDSRLMVLHHGVHKGAIEFRATELVQSRDLLLVGGVHRTRNRHSTLRRYRAPFVLHRLVVGDHPLCELLDLSVRSLLLRHPPKARLSAVGAAHIHDQCTVALHCRWPGCTRLYRGSSWAR